MVVVVVWRGVGDSEERRALDSSGSPPPGASTTGEVEAARRGVVSVVMASSLVGWRSGAMVDYLLLSLLGKGERMRVRLRKRLAPDF